MPPLFAVTLSGSPADGGWLVEAAGEGEAVAVVRGTDPAARECPSGELSAWPAPVAAGAECPAGWRYLGTERRSP